MAKAIIMFYGRECPHCHVMLPLADRLEKEEKIAINRLEVWHDDKNTGLMRKHRQLIEDACGGEFGVPAFMDEKGEKALCGERPYEELRDWARKAAKG